MHISKKGIRALGIAESYSGREQSVICGVAMRKDLRIDGVGYGTVTVGGTDATDSILSLVKKLKRSDINLLLLGGCVISWYNIIDPLRLYQELNLPVICVTYEASEGLLDDIKKHFPGDAGRISTYLSLGERFPVTLKTGRTIYLRSWGITDADSAKICDDFTLDGKVPEPVRVARLSARAFMRYGYNLK
jgi:endonuclease V-like protein UPF0215 family